MGCLVFLAGSYFKIKNNMDSLKTETIIFLGIDALVKLIVICIFLYRLKYVKQYGLFLWGIYFFLDITFLGIAKIIHSLFFTHLPEYAVTGVFTNILSIFHLGIILIIYSQFKPIKPQLLMGTFIIFLLLFLISSQSYKTDDTTLTYPILFAKILVFVLMAIYLLDLHSESMVKFTQIPFFFIAMGWLLDCFISVTLYMEQVIVDTNEEHLSQNSILMINALVGIGASIFYIIGFWKTKEYVLKNQLTE